MKTIYVLVFSLILIMGCNKKTEHKPIKTTSLLDYVDPFIGTGGHGHTYPGATVPFGMLQVSPVNGISAWDWCSGYHYSDSIAIGFSHLNLSGTGIGDLADILFMPVNKEVDLSINPISRDSISYKSAYNHNNEKASPGYYQVFLEDHNINVELTTSKRTASHKYTFNQDDIQSVVINLGFAINWDKALETSIKIEDKYTISGYRFSTGWAKNQKVFFVAKFSKPIANYKLYEDGKLSNKDFAESTKTSSQLFFNADDSNELQAKVALSSVSVENAKANLEADTFNFEAEKLEAENIWDKAAYLT